MNDEKRQQLINLGAASLADALLELANWNERAEDLLERMISTREECIARFKEKLAALHKIHKFIPWGRSAAFARELDSILDRARSKAYHHGKDYLEFLIEMAQSITDWGSTPSHQSYANRLLETHYRKRSFWSCYRE